MASSHSAERQVLFYVGRDVHPLYREQYATAPAGFRYRPAHPGLVQQPGLKRDLALHGSVRETVTRQAINCAMFAGATAGYVRRKRVRELQGSDLIHSVQFLLKDSTVPYVVDFEHVTVFGLYQRAAVSKARARRALIDAMCQTRCRFVLPWTDAARRGLLALIGPKASAELSSRIVTVLPSIRATASAPRARGDGPLRVLFVGTTFFGKGGPEAILAVERLRRTHQVELDMVTVAPPEWQERASEHPWIRIHERISGAALCDLFAQRDVLLFPAHVDTLGFVVLEALAAGMPVVASDHFALPELVEHEVSGLVFAAESSLYDSEFLPRFPRFLPTRYPKVFIRELSAPSDSYLDRVAGSLARLAEDRDGYERLSAGALERVRDGVLSPERRRRQLKRLYTEALS